MFRATGRSRTAFQLFGEVAAGCSFGGLALFTEDKRRQIALCKRVIENGRIVQGFAAYHSAVAVTEPEGAVEYPWNTKPTTHTIDRQSTVESVTPVAKTGADSKASGDDDSAGRRQLLSSHISPTTISQSPRSSLQPPVRVASFNPLGERLRTGVARKTLTDQDKEHQQYILATRRYREELEQYGLSGQAKLAPTIIASLKEESTHAAATERLTAFFDFKEPSTLHRSMRQALNLVKQTTHFWSSLPERTQTSIDNILTRQQSDEQISDRTPSIPASDLPLQNRNVNQAMQTAFKSPSLATSKQDAQADDIVDAISQNHVNVAHRELLALLQDLTGPISLKVRQAVDMLLDIYRSERSTKLVRGIQKQIMDVVKNLTYVREEFLWLVHNELPCRKVELCLDTIQLLLTHDRREQAVQIWDACASWFCEPARALTTRSLNGAIEVFLTTFNTDRPLRSGRQFELIAGSLWEQAITKESFSKARRMFEWMSTTNCTHTISLDTCLQVFDQLTEARLHADAVVLYAECLRTYDLNVKNPLIHKTLTAEILHKALKLSMHAQCRDILGYMADKNLSLSETDVARFLSAAKDRLIGHFTASKNTRFMIRTFDEPSVSGSVADLIPALHSLTNIVLRHKIPQKLVVILEVLSHAGGTNVQIFEALVSELYHASRADLIGTLVKRYSGLQHLSWPTVDRILKACPEMLHYPGIDCFASESLERVCDSYTREESKDAVRELILGYFRQKQFRKIINFADRHDLDLSRDQVLYAMVYSARLQAGPINQMISVTADLKVVTNKKAVFWIDRANEIALKRSYRATRNLQVCEDLFDQISDTQVRQARGEVSSHLYSAMISACVKHGLVDRAQYYADQMTKSGIQTNVYSLGHLMLGKALCQDWEGVEKILASKAFASIKSQKTEGRGSSFNGIVHHYCRHHNAHQILDFAKRWIKTYQAEISIPINRRITSTMMVSQNLDLVASWTSLLKGIGLRPILPMDSVDQFRRYHERIKQAVDVEVVNDPKAKANDRLTAEVDIEAYVDKTEVMNSGVYTTDEVDLLSSENKKSPRHNMHQMLDAINSGEPEHAIQIYKALIGNALPGSSDLQMCVKACLKLDPPSRKLAEDFVAIAAAEGLNVDKASRQLLIHDLDQSATLTEKEARRIVFDYYQATENDILLPLNHHLTVAVTRHLHMRGAGAAALNILLELRDSKWVKHAPFDLSIMSLLLQVLIRLGHLEGAKQAMHEILTSDHVRIDPRFLEVFKALRNKTLHSAGSSGDYTAIGDDNRVLGTMLDDFIEKAKIRMREQLHKSRTFVQKTVELWEKELGPVASQEEKTYRWSHLKSPLQMRDQTAFQ